MTLQAQARLPSMNVFRYDQNLPVERDQQGRAQIQSFDHAVYILALCDRVAAALAESITRAALNPARRSARSVEFLEVHR